MKRKLTIIGLDPFSYEWLEPLFSRGYLFNVKRLMKEGSFCLLKTPIVGGDCLELEYEKITKEDYEKVGIPDIGTWKWPMRIPPGAHSDIAMLLISGPGIKKGYRCRRKYSLLNVVPTTCHVAGLPKPRDHEGGIIMEILDSEGTEEL